MSVKNKKADFEAQSMYKREEKQAELDELWRLYRQIIERHDCVTIKDLAINGKDLMERGIEQGPEIGAILNRVLDKVLDNPSLNTREQLLELL